MKTRTLIRIIVFTFVFLGLAVFATNAISEPAKRAYSMGFSLTLPPISDFDDLLTRFDIWRKRADASITHIDVPWELLLNGVSADEAVRKDLLSRINLMRSNGITNNVITIEPLNGVNRMSEAEALIKAGRSISDLDIQKLYINYVVAVADIVKPKYLGLAAEVNLIDMVLPPEIYKSLVKMTNAAAGKIKKNNPQIPLYVSFQVEAAWGSLGNKKFIGINKYFKDFAFIDIVGLATYPYDPNVGWLEPSNIPDEYFTKLTEGYDYPIIISETGWPSNFDLINTSERIQAQWIKKMAELADASNVLFIGYILFSDVHPDIAQDNIQQFISQGLVNYNFEAKPALTAWDRIYNRKSTRRFTR